MMISHSRSTRRQFLQTAAATAFAAPYVITQSLRGQDRPAPSNRLTMGFIGIGNMGGGHLGAFLGNGDVQILAVCDVDRVKRDNAKKQVETRYGDAMTSGEYKGCAAYNEFEELLARPDIDAVLIAVPDHWHAMVAIAACKAGKDVYCEKPLALTIREARAMVNAARRYNRVFQVGSQQRSEANFRYACELVRNGRIGKILQVNVGVGGPSRERYFPEEPVRDGLDWERWLGPAPWQPYNAERCSGNFGGGWRMIRDYSGGMMTDWGAHHYDIAQWGLGMDESGPVEIIPPKDGAPYYLDPDPDTVRKPIPESGQAPLFKQPQVVEEGKTLMYKYANGVKMFHGGANGILFTGTDGKIEVNRGYFKTWPDSIGQEPIGPNEIHLYKSPGHQVDWLNCIRTRRRPICDVEVGCRTITVCHLGNIAYWTGRPQHWDPVKEELSGDAEAARWLDRAKRAPWRTYV